MFNGDALAVKAPRQEALPPDDEHRRRILEDLDATMLVEAAAGTGKTTCMIRRMVALLREGRCRIETLAAVTFTRKSTAELRARFQIELERAAAAESGEIGRRLADALRQVERCFIGTIHSFCGRLLRERPIEAGVDVAFKELDDASDGALRDEAWHEHVARLHAEDDPILAELEELGLQCGQLQEAFNCLSGYPDVERWPAREVELPDLASVAAAMERYAAYMEGLSPTFPADRGNDKLMSAYELIPRLVRQMNRARPADVMAVVANFKNVSVVQKQWPGGASQGKAEKNRWEDFVRETAQPLVDLWLERRYAAVLRAVRPAMEVYDRRRRQAGGLNFQDLLLKAAALLRDKPAIRRYFRERFSHVLVDEFQDTDPVQAEVMLLLTAESPEEKDWRRCRPAPGSLFVVGDPKQSIYRFRRADIVIYNQVKKIILASDGVVVPLTANFRTIGELVGWCNGVFDEVFPAEASAWSPAACPMLVGRTGEKRGELHGLHVLRVPEPYGAKELSIDYEASFVARTIRRALDNGIALARAGGTASAAMPGDFLIVTKSKKQLATYAQKLGELGIPHQVTGGSALGQLSELTLLSKCLAAVNEPDNPVALVAVLRGELFGISDVQLYAFRKAGGRFDYRTQAPTAVPIPEQLAPFEDAYARLRRYRRWLGRIPPVSATERIAADLGLTMRAAAAADGNVLAGSLAKALESLRSAQLDFHSAADLVAYLTRLIDENREFDGMPARPHDGSAVRLMNLHKVKGLEAPVVFLADPTGVFDHGVDLHIDRSGDQARGYLNVYGPKMKYQRPLLARPPDSAALFQAEKQFQQTEDQRLLYVAATRAGAALSIVQRDKGNHQNPWAEFQPYLGGCAELPDPGPQVRLAGPELEVNANEVSTGIAAIADRWSRCAAPTYAVAAAKELSLASSTIRLGATDGEHGAAWGTVIHLLLETALKHPTGDLLLLARSALVEVGLDIGEAEYAVAIVQKVAASDVFRRARAADRWLVEVPFQTLGPAGGAKALNGLPTVIRGVVDLAFREPSGWVIVDYKSDRLALDQMPSAIEHYRAQLDLYAGAWAAMTGESVHERGLYFTHLDAYAVV